MYDMIGDIHGHAVRLKKLLVKLRYSYGKGTYTHPGRKVLFIGDYIDRGPQIRETLEIVKGMVDTGNAVALLGNHEYNALCFHCQESKGGHLRKHSIKNIIQHYETLRQFQGRQKEYEDYLKWFKSLPLFYETESFRAVHACWDSDCIAYLHQHLYKSRLTDELIAQSVRQGSKLNHAIGITLKGVELEIPDNLAISDTDGNKRTELRIKWWEKATGKTFKEMSVKKNARLPDIHIPRSLLPKIAYYKKEEKPVFFGHYALDGNPIICRDNVCCLDYGVANKGHLVAYRFNGETHLSSKSFVQV